MAETPEEWLRYSTENEHIKLYPNMEFVNISSNDEGRFSVVSSSDWIVASRKVALKKLKQFEIERFVLEIKLHSLCQASKNVVGFLGLTQGNSEYSMVLEFADLGNLRAFLRKGINRSWDTKLKLSLDIAKGLSYLHHCKIYHRDLHPNNIVINQIHQCKQPEYIARITDFGGAIKKGDKDLAGVIGQIPFTDPKFLNDPYNYTRDHKSDIYSLGVIFWEISAGKSPFEDYLPESRGDFRDLSLTLEIISYLREERVDPTPDNYYKLYTDCWQFNPSQRPRITGIIETLNIIRSGQPGQ